jgi:ribosomal protein S18 acetylase RimI-like enzyme
LLGAFDDAQLAGLAILRYHLSEDTAQLAFLHVSNGHRRKGAGNRLTEEVVRLARASGAKRLYVSSVPSESAVGFYRSHGFEPTRDVHPELFELEPEDIHMTKPL